MLNKKIIVECPMGIHLRPAGAVSENASRYHSKITFEYKEGKTANAKSMLSILAAGIKCGIRRSYSYFERRNKRLIWKLDYNIINLIIII